MGLAVSALVRWGVALFFGTPFEVAAMRLAVIAGAAFLLVSMLGCWSTLGGRAEAQVASRLADP